MIAQSLFYRPLQWKASLGGLLSSLRADLYIYLVGVSRGNNFIVSRVRKRKRSTATIIAVLALSLIGCVNRTGFQLKDESGCQDCYHSFYFLTSDGTEASRQKAVSLALEGDYSGARALLFQTNPGATADDSPCFLSNNQGLLELLQGQNGRALELLWEAHRQCPDNTDIENNLKNQLSRFPSSAR
tara:strand:- start:60541 stop:61098 length:558 start_codon:yes stop_codon:yes gene_type:complete